MKELVSIIVPCFNVEEYIEECLESILGQTYSNLEIILVNDGSTDDTLPICKKYALTDERIRIISQSNQGLSVARNIGMKEATGKYIYFCDGDDYIAIDMISNLIKQINNQEIDFVFFDAITITQEGMRVEHESYTRKINYEGSKVGYSLLENLLEHNEYFACIPLHFYLRDFLLNNKLEFIEGIIHEDESFSFFSYLYAKHVVRDSHAYYYRRIREGSICTSNYSIENVIGFERGASLIREKCKQHLIEKQKEKVVLLYLFRLMRIAATYFSYLNRRDRKLIIENHCISIYETIIFSENKNCTLFICQKELEWIIEDSKSVTTSNTKNSLLCKRAIKKETKRILDNCDDRNKLPIKVFLLSCSIVYGLYDLLIFLIKLKNLIRNRI